MKLTLKLPVKPFFVNQPFGAVYNLQYYKDNGLPIIGHNGTDLMAKHGHPVFASHEGLAYFETDDKQGDGVVICSEQQYDYSGYQCFFKTVYWHFLPDYQIPSGTRVKAGDFIGWADSTGLSTGDHLHWALKPQNPASDPFERNNIEQNNGYLGAIDPMPFTDGTFAQDIPSTYEFLHDINYADTSPEVVMLQVRLVQLGFLLVNPTGFYGALTKAAVKAYQDKYVAKDWWSSAQVALNQGRSVGPLTRKALNL